MQQPAPADRTWPLLLGALATSLGCFALAGLGPAPAPSPTPVTVVPTAGAAPPAPPSGPAPCDGAQVTDTLEAMAHDLAARRILYQSEPLSDCSGMAHRLLGDLRQSCPELSLPSPHQARSAADLAAWFDDAGQLVPLAGPEDADRWLVPGTLAFFERSGVDAVGHVGLVVSVDRDEDGRVQSYAMFHGRHPGVAAGVTAWHLRAADPPLGNGADALVGIAFPSPTLALLAPVLGGTPSEVAIADAWEADEGTE